MKLDLTVFHELSASLTLETQQVKWSWSWVINMLPAQTWQGLVYDVLLTYLGKSSVFALPGNS